MGDDIRPLLLDEAKKEHYKNKVKEALYHIDNVKYQITSLEEKIKNLQDDIAETQKRITEMEV